MDEDLSKDFETKQLSFYSYEPAFYYFLFIYYFTHKNGSLLWGWWGGEVHRV